MEKVCWRTGTFVEKLVYSYLNQTPLYLNWRNPVTLSDHLWIGVMHVLHETSRHEFLLFHQGGATLFCPRNLLPRGVLLFNWGEAYRLTMAKCASAITLLTINASTFERYQTILVRLY